jgi:hypothetical protein
MFTDVRDSMDRNISESIVEVQTFKISPGSNLRVVNLSRNL